MKNGFRAFIMLVVLLHNYKAKAQNYPMVSDNGGTVWLSETVVFNVGTDINVGTGATDDGSFKYIRISSQSWMHNNSKCGINSRYVNEANCLPVRFTGLKMHIKKIRFIGDQKRGYVVYLILGGGTATNYECDIVQAVKAGEIECQQCETLRKTGSTVIASNQLSTADELAKLKRLKDEGVLSEPEYQTQKSKLLDR